MPGCQYCQFRLVHWHCPICRVQTDEPGPCSTCLGADTVGSAVLKVLALLFALGFWGAVAALAVS